MLPVVALILVVFVVAAARVYRMVAFYRGPDGNLYSCTRGDLPRMMRMRKNMTNLIKTSGHPRTDMALRRLDDMAFIALPPGGNEFGYVRCFWPRKEFAVRLDLEQEVLDDVVRHEIAHLLTPNWLSHGQDFHRELALIAE